MKTEAVIERFIINELMFGDGPPKIDPDKDLISTGFLDSVAVLRLLLFIEEQFKVRIEDNEVLPDNFRTIEQIKTFIENKQPVPKPVG